MAKILGLSAFFHDAAAALIVDGEVVAAAQEERFSRRKHDARLPIEAARFCLAHAGLAISDLDHVVFYEKPLRKLERILVTHLRELPRGAASFARSMATWLGSRLWVKAEISEALGCHPDRVLFSEHHLSHAASAFYCSPFERAAIVTADGVGEWATTTIGIANGSGITTLRELRFPHSIGLLYSAITAYLGFEVNEGEYKVMGLASYGEPRFIREMEVLCHIADDGSLELDLSYFAFHHHPTRSFTPKLEALLGPARSPANALDLAHGDRESQRWADVAASLQAHTERYLLTLARAAHELTGERHLCFAGGVALNSVANGRIAREGPFDDVFVQPAAGDAGAAIGAALHLEHGVLGTPRRPYAMRSPFLGAAWTAREVEAFLSQAGVRHTAFADDAARDRAVAERLASGMIGGWFQGRFEWGPRALGARSILADPRRADAKERVNLAVKFREPFRPFAPAVREGDASTYFDVDPRDHLAPYMLTVVPVRDEARASLPAITHVDGTARLQRVARNDPPGLHGLLDAFAERTGVGVLLNTSMNLKDEPLVASPAEAYGVFLRSGLDFLVMERCLVERSSS